MAAPLRSQAFRKLIVYKRVINLSSNYKQLKCQYHIASLDSSAKYIKKNNEATGPQHIQLYLNRFQSTSSLGLSTAEGASHAHASVGVRTVSDFVTTVNDFSQQGTEALSKIQSSTNNLNIDNLASNGVSHAVEESVNGVIHSVEESTNGVQMIETTTSGVNYVENLSSPIYTEELPALPPIPSTPTEEILTSDVVAESINTLTSVGLGGWFPPGIVQQCLNFLHESGSLPWWLAIFAGTLTVRLCMFPLVVYGQRNSVHTSNNMPQIQLLQTKMTEARRSGDHLETARYGNEMMEFMKDKDVNPLRSLVLPLVQAPIFISFFIGLRKMANLPLESMKDGGIYWFQNLTIADPYFILPVLTSVTLFATIELGAEGLRADSMKTAKYVLRAMPLIILPFTINFPAAILCYWLSSNLISLGQVSLLRIPAVKERFNIPPVSQVAEQIRKKNQKGFVESFKDSFTNTKITKELEERTRLDEIMFKKSGIGPVPKTYAYDPTKQNPKNNTVLTKKR